MSTRRPEHLAPPELYYNDEEAKKYTFNSRIMDIQVQMTERALELLALPEDRQCMLLDIGCGSGLSGSVLEENGHIWVGMDISASMLKIAVDREVSGDLILSDMGHGVPFKAGTFDGAISISALQWLCNIDKNEYNCFKRLKAFFTSLFISLSSGARAIFQFYPENDKQLNIITTAATGAGFFGGTVIDFPNSKKAKKFFLVLMTSGVMNLPQAYGDNQNINQNVNIKNSLKKNAKGKNSKNKNLFKLKIDTIMKKKERRLKQGKNVARDSKYTGRKRKDRL
uniref:18S rRNA (guanine-N(7))-methyltransferase n=1 Tax=Encarsia formosa TaxID=32400 RepID=A0A481SZU4_ENCFO|nr:hypothetical protein [Encarsia formosa]